ncbi:hypothetical protein TREMEDRAFT_63424 [Tremella mesenterica DSM 1558]|uniref:uncharacterized protein n=1 Tax=Tremella mesenterica (strain ATCC 24925 / CBS 8224 / DSM 1558 / NBRC 9311 / NRRL Y-6157 / RJB 2259-6 / UBC 559-6) TaxID=578456 RepID=UPI0003F49820|nr:uncharacterized protein TREMEDRAFT_63424 [Tremella mesenterica DSM 1558]EIW68251.1 hypothetical protein TREMEDRAFT_63424 [Tremella mesenterica DSM 1558]
MSRLPGPPPTHGGHYAPSQQPPPLYYPPNHSTPPQHHHHQQHHAQTPHVGHSGQFDPSYNPYPRQNVYPTPPTPVDVYASHSRAEYPSYTHQQSQYQLQGLRNGAHSLPPPVAQAGPSSHHAPGWSSVLPTPKPMAPPQRTERRVSGVKLEDLVSSDRVRPGSSKGSLPAGGLTSLPLVTSQGSEKLTGMGGGGSSTGGVGGVGSGAGGGGGGGGGGDKQGPSEFIKKLFKMLEEESALYGNGLPPGQPRGEGAPRGSVGWAKGGTTFVVWDINDFTTKVFFVRQLNKYGFSKVKHIDEETGQHKDTIWEFQHPNFRAGHTSDLDGIRRKAVLPKKSTEVEGDAAQVKSLAVGDMARMVEMERRIIGLEDGLSKAVDELREANTRETGLLSLIREMISQLEAVERESTSSPSSQTGVSPRITHLYTLFDRLMHNHPAPPYIIDSVPMGRSASSGMYSRQGPFRDMSHNTSGPAYAPAAQVSPKTDGDGTVSEYGDNNSPQGSKASSVRPDTGIAPHYSNGHMPTHVQGQMTAQSQNQEQKIDLGMQNLVRQEQDDVIELPPQSQQQTLYNGDPLSMTPVFADTPAWLTEGQNASTPIYHRKSSDEVTMRLVVEALIGHSAPSGSGGPSLPGAQIPMDQPTIPLEEMPRREPIDSRDINQQAVVQQGPPVIQPAPYEAAAPPSNNAESSPSSSSGNGVRLRKTTAKPHWTQTPRILVVEDDVVYRQLSSKFLEKFGCETETVDDAQGAIERMNKTKYDLVLMDIFFGPSMDGRKATSLIRQFDIYTPIISMTSNVKKQDVSSYFQSGMNDVLAKPFTKHGLFGILDKHLIHLKAIQLSGEVPRSLGVPPLSDQGVVDALVASAQWNAEELERNPLAGMGVSDDTYQLVVQQFISTGTLPDFNALANAGMLNGPGTYSTPDPTIPIPGQGIGTTIVFGDSSGFNRKRSIETVEDWQSPEFDNLVDPDTRTKDISHGKRSKIL